MKIVGRVNFKYLDKSDINFQCLGKTIYCTFINYKTGETFSRFYKTESAAKAAATKFNKKLNSAYVKERKNNEN